MMSAEHLQIRNFIVFSLLAHLLFAGLLSAMQLFTRLPADRPLQVRIIDRSVRTRVSPPLDRRMLGKFAAHTPWVPPPLQSSPGLAVTSSPKVAHVEPLEGEGVGGSTRPSDLRGQLAMLWKSLDAQQYTDQKADTGEEGDASSPAGPTVSLDSQDSRFAPYLLGVKRRIESVWSYPPAARGLTGNLVVTFGITRDGHLSDLQLTQTSGIAPLDNEAIRAIRQATPFTPFPERMRFERLNIRAAFYYHVSRTSFRDQ